MTQQKDLTLANENVPVPCDKFSIILSLKKIQNFHFLKFRAKTQYCVLPLNS